jgi:hypothetical protein
MKSRKPDLPAAIPPELMHRRPRHLDGIREKLWPSVLRSNGAVLVIGGMIGGGIGLFAIGGLIVGHWPLGVVLSLVSLSVGAAVAFTLHDSATTWLNLLEYGNAQMVTVTSKSVPGSLVSLVVGGRSGRAFGEEHLVRAVSEGDQFMAFALPPTGHPGPRLYLIPELRGLRFTRRHDQRNPVLNPPELQDDPGTGEATLWSGPPPPPIWLRMFARSKTRTRAGVLTWNSERLQVAVRGTGTFELRWDRPWRIAVSASVVTDDICDVHLSIREQGAAATSRSVELSIQLPHGQVSSHVPEQWETHPFVPADAVARLLPILMGHANANGDTEFMRMLTTRQASPADRLG